MLKSENYLMSGIYLESGLLSHREEGLKFCEGAIANQYKSVADIFYFSLGGDRNWKYFGFRIGISYVKREKGFCDEAPLSFVIPMVVIRFGVIGKLFASISALDDIVFLPIAVGLNYHFSNHKTRIWAGGAGYNKNWKYGIKASYKMRKTLFITETIYRPSKQSFGLRLGIGRVF